MQTDTPQPAVKPAGGRFAFRYQALLVATMIVSSAMCVFLFAVRWVKTGQTTYYTLNVNLILAWIPVIFAWVAYNVYRKGSCLGAAIALTVRPSMAAVLSQRALSDHRSRPSPRPPGDAVLVRPDPLHGLRLHRRCYLGMISLILMQSLVRRALGWILSWIFAFAALVLSGFGIYLGRFLRFNSWDLLLNPKPLLKEIFSWVRHPKSNSDAFIFALTFSVFFSAIYFVIVGILNLQRAQSKE